MLLRTETDNVLVAGIGLSLFVCLVVDMPLFSVPDPVPPPECDQECHNVEWVAFCPSLNVQYEIPDCRNCGSGYLCLEGTNPGAYCVDKGVNFPQRQRVTTLSNACPCEGGLDTVEGNPVSNTAEWIGGTTIKACAD